MNCMWVKIELGCWLTGPCESFSIRNCQYFFELSEIHLVIFDNSKNIYFWLLDPVLSELGKERGKEIYQFKLWTKPSFLNSALCSKRHQNSELKKYPLPFSFSPFLSSFPPFLSSTGAVKSQTSIYRLNVEWSHDRLSPRGTSRGWQ